MFDLRQTKNAVSCVTTAFNNFMKWCHQESNRGHKDFQSFALPTELWHQHCSNCECKDKRIFEIYKICK